MTSPLKNRVKDNSLYIWNAIVNAPTTVRKTVFGVLAVLSAIWILTTAVGNWQDGKREAEITAYQAEVAKAVQNANATKVQVDSMKWAIDSLNSQAVFLGKELAKSKKATLRSEMKAQASLDSLHTVTTSKDTIGVLFVVIEQKDEVIDETKRSLAISEEMNRNLAAQSAKKDTIIVKVTATADSAITLLQKAPKPDKCAEKFLFCKVPKPSRLQTFVGGTLSGLLAAVALR